MDLPMVTSITISKKYFLALAAIFVLAGFLFVDALQTQAATRTLLYGYSAPMLLLCKTHLR